MSRRARVTHKKSRVTPAKRNVNPKLSAFQREKKRNRLANQPPVDVREHDAPSSARGAAAFIAEQRQKRKERHERMYGEKGSKSNNNKSNNSASAAESAAASSSTSGSHPLIQNATSLNTMIGEQAGENALSSRSRLSVLQKKAELRLKKKLKRRTKRELIQEHTLRSLLAKDRADEEKRGGSKKKQQNRGRDDNGGNDDDDDIRDGEFCHHDDDNGKKKGNMSAVAAKAASNVPLTRKEKKQLQVQQAREAANKRKKQLAALGSDMEEENLDDDGDGKKKKNAADNNNDDDDDDNSGKIGHQSSAAEAAKGKSKKMSGKRRGREEDPIATWEKQMQKQHREQQRGKKVHNEVDIDYVRFGERVDAPPVLDVVPSLSAAAALQRRTAKMSRHSDADAAKHRLFDVAGHTSLSEAAQKRLHGLGLAGQHQLIQQQQQLQQQQNNDNAFERPVAGAKLQSAQDFAALREQVMARYAKAHPVSFGKSRAYAD